jgi:hypothetical protein
LYSQSLEVLQSLQSTRAMLRGHASAGQDVIEFAVPHTLAFTFFPAWVSSLREKFGPIKSRLIALNVHDAVLRTLAEGGLLDDVLAALEPNDVGLLQAPHVPAPLRAAGVQIRGAVHHLEEAAHSSLKHVLTRVMAMRLIARLRNGCVLLDPEACERAEAWVMRLPEPAEPFVDPLRIDEDAGRIRDGVLGMLHLHRMPTEIDVAVATVFFMADRAISGETFEPSGGLQQERTNTERELFGRAKPERVQRMEGETVWLIGEHMVEPLVAVARLFLAEAQVGSIVTLTRTAEAGEKIRTLLGRGRAKKGMFEGDLDNGELEIGQVAARIDTIRPAAEIIRNIINQYTQIGGPSLGGRFDFL